ncbi:MAG: helix-turn-helix transcriptional regulator [Anaerolineales bacterium]|nr:helix-turn-helix transcriptional regulator [Anaerolineales bacterium]
MEQPGGAIARNIRRIREDRNVSLDGLAELTGVSKSMLRQIEIGQSNPTIATLWKIANGVHIPFTALLRDPDQKITLGAFKEGDPLLAETVGYRLYPLITFTPERAFEAYYMEIDPGTQFDAAPHQGGAEEHVFVVAGAIEITVAEEHFDVLKDHFIGFQADCSHCYHNSGSSTAAAFMLLSYLP